MDYLQLPCPVKYEELQREALSKLAGNLQLQHVNQRVCVSITLSVITNKWLSAVSLKPDLFEGLKFDFSKPLNMNFAVTHR